METKTMYLIGINTISTGEILEVEGSFDGKYFYYYELGDPQQAIKGEYFEELEEALKVVEEKRQAALQHHREVIENLKKVKFRIRKIQND